MKEYLENYIKELEKKKNLSKEELEQVLIKIKFFQHERLIHLIVTVFVGIVACLFLLGFLALENVLLFILFILMIILFIPYIFHYYFLENNVQRLYKIYDNLKEKLDD